MYITLFMWDTYPEVLQNLFWTIWKVLTSFFNLAFKQFLTHLFTLSSIPLPDILLFISLMRGRLISIISYSVALLTQSLSRGRTIIIQWQRSSFKRTNTLIMRIFSALKLTINWLELHGNSKFGLCFKMNDCLQNWRLSAKWLHTYTHDKRLAPSIHTFP